MEYDYSHIFKGEVRNFKATVLKMVEDQVSYKDIKKWFWSVDFQPNKDQLSFIYDKTHNGKKVV
jgi:hypothetical protein